MRVFTVDDRGSVVFVAVLSGHVTSASHQPELVWLLVVASADTD